MGVAPEQAAVLQACASTRLNCLHINFALLALQLFCSEPEHRAQLGASLYRYQIAAPSFHYGSRIRAACLSNQCPWEHREPAEGRGREGWIAQKLSGSEG